MHQSRKSCVVEISVNEQSTFDVFEFGEREIARSSRVTAFFAKDSEADVSFLDHAHVISAVAYRAGYRLLLARLDKLNNLFERKDRIKQASEVLVMKLR